MFEVSVVLRMNSSICTARAASLPWIHEISLLRGTLKLKIDLYLPALSVIFPCHKTHTYQSAGIRRKKTRFSSHPCDHMVWRGIRWSRTNAQRLSYQSRLPVFAFNGCKGWSWNLKYQDYHCHSSFGHWAHKCAVEHKLNSEQAFCGGVNLGAVQVFLAHLTTLPVQLSPFPISSAPCITR